MLELVNSYIRQNQLFAEGQRILLAVSGGIDSMVLAHIALESGWDVGVAHCNFQLRGEESEGDETFVAHWASRNGIPFYSRRFDTLAASAQGGVSIQMAARELRYEWLESARISENYDRIATAHHLNDAIETFLYNLSKGSGLKGLQGIPPQNGVIIRPLLEVSRRQIEEYAEQHDIKYREDASNAADKYARNYIRHHLMPVFRDLNPAFERTMSGNIRRIKEARMLMLEQIELLRQRYTEQPAPGVWRIHKKLAEHPAALTVMLEWLSPLGFSADQLEQVLSAVHHQNANFFTSTHRLIVDRQYFLISSLKDAGQADIFIINNNQHIVEIPGASLIIEKKEGRPESFPEGSHFAFVDAGKVDFPLLLRHWQPGDWFCPIGMAGRKKKIQDFFTDAKLSQFDKEKVWILTTQTNDIVWIVGHRLDDRFKVSEHTHAYFQITFELQSLSSF